MNNTPPEVLEKWRAEFEAKYLELSGFGSLERRGDVYAYQVVQASWAFWVASRQSVRIELPKPLVEFDGMDEPSCYYKPSQIVGALRSQGYTVNN